MIEKGGYLQSSQYGNLYQAVNERGGYLQSTQPRPNRVGVTEKDLEIPKSITFPLDLGYAKGLQGHFDGSDSENLPQSVPDRNDMRDLVIGCQLKSFTV